MILSPTDIVVTALGVLALVGVAVAVSAWRHVVRMERDVDKAAAETGLPSAV